jgi:hypothetical protein
MFAQLTVDILCGDSTVKCLLFLFNFDQISLKSVQRFSSCYMERQIM